MSLENVSSGRKCRTQLLFFTDHQWPCRTVGCHWWGSAEPWL